MSIEYHESKYSVLAYTLDPCGEIKCFFFFSESGNVAYQIKVKDVKTNKQAKILTLHTPLTSGSGLKGQILKLCK